MSLIEFETHVGEPVSIRYTKAKVVPFSTTTIFGNKNLPFGILWTRPASVAVHHPDGSIDVLKIEDVTRKIQLGILGIGILGSILTALAYGNMKKGA